MSNTHNTAKTQFLETHGVRYAYRRFGSGNKPPLLCLQHFRGGLDNWDPQVTDGLAQGRSVILFNNAGIASSGGAPANNIAEMATHVTAFLDKLGLKEIDLLGFSMGGFIAQQVTLSRPHLIRRLVLAGTGPQGGEDMVAYPPEVTAQATIEVPTEESFLYLFFEPTATSQAAGRAFWQRRNARKDQDTPSSLSAMAAQAAAISAWGKIPEKDRYARLKTIHQPTLVVNGKHDLLVPTINSYILQQHLPNATLIIYPDSGHGAIFQFSELFVREAQFFLNS
jgi:pimeloyl-ACP methyl ester carboxylesterase